MAYKPQVTILLSGGVSNLENTFSSRGVNGISDLVQQYNGMRSAQELILATLLSELKPLKPVDIYEVEPARELEPIDTGHSPRHCSGHSSRKVLSSGSVPSSGHVFSPAHVSSVVANKLAEAYGDERIQRAYASLDSVQLAHNPMTITLAYLVRTYVRDQYNEANEAMPDEAASASVEEIFEVDLSRNLEALATAWNSEHFTAGVSEYMSNAFTGEKTWQECLESLSTYIGSASAIAFWTSSSSAGELAFQRGAKGASNPRRLEKLHDLAGTAYATRDAALVLGLLRNPKNQDLLEEELIATRGKDKARAIPLTPFVPVNWNSSDPEKGVFDLIY